MNGALIKRYRLAANMKRTTLANELNINVTTLQRIENDKISISLERLHDIAKVLGISIVELFDEKNLLDPNPKNYDKYGQAESRLIQYLKLQIDSKDSQIRELTESNIKLLDNLKTLNDNLKRLMDFFATKDLKGKKKTKKSIQKK